MSWASRIDQIITSPLLRTRQTADVIAESLKGKPAVVTSDALSPAGTPGGCDAGSRQARQEGKRGARRATSRTSASWRRD